MTRVILFFSILVIFKSASGQYQSTMVVNPNGKIFFNDKKVKKTKELKSILAEKNSSELNNMFKKYRNKHLVHSLISRIRDFSLTYGVINEEFKPTIQPIPLAISIVGTAVSLITRKSQNKQLNELVDYFNYHESAEMYLKESKGINP